MPRSEPAPPIELHLPETIGALTKMFVTLWGMSPYLTWFSVIMVFAIPIYAIYQWPKMRSRERALSKMVSVPKKLRKAKKLKTKVKQKDGGAE